MRADCGIEPRENLRDCRRIPELWIDQGYGEFLERYMGDGGCRNGFLDDDAAGFWQGFYVLRV